MEVEVREKIISMLKSGDPEMKDLAVHLFCQSKPMYIHYRLIEVYFRWENFTYPGVEPYLLKMRRCIRG